MSDELSFDDIVLIFKQYIALDQQYQIYEQEFKEHLSGRKVIKIPPKFENSEQFDAWNKALAERRTLREVATRKRNYYLDALNNYERRWIDELPMGSWFKVGRYGARVVYNHTNFPDHGKQKCIDYKPWTEIEKGNN